MQGKCVTNTGKATPMIRILSQEVPNEVHHPEGSAAAVAAQAANIVKVVTERHVAAAVAAEVEVVVVADVARTPHMQSLHATVALAVQVEAEADAVNEVAKNPPMSSPVAMVAVVVEVAVQAVAVKEVARMQSLSEKILDLLGTFLVVPMAVHLARTSSKSPQSLGRHWQIAESLWPRLSEKEFQLRSPCLRLRIGSRLRLLHLLDVPRLPSRIDASLQTTLKG